MMRLNYGHGPLQDSGKVRVFGSGRGIGLERWMRRHGHTVASQRHSVGAPASVVWLKKEGGQGRASTEIKNGLWVARHD